MIAELTSWELASLFFKISWYLGVVMAAGGTFAIWLIGDDSRRFIQRNLIYILAGALLGFHAVILYLLAQVGAINASGLAGMLDWPMIRFYLGLEVGEASLMRMAVLLLLIAGQLFALSHIMRLMKPPGRSFFQLLFRFNGACLLLLVLSFQATGHIAALSLATRAFLVIHVGGITLWLGSLWPLLLSTWDYGHERSQYIMRRFGRLASYFVAGLLVGGIWVLTRVVASPVELIQTTYGRSLVLKLVLVCCLLGLAAANRWRLVPVLSEPRAMVTLRRSIGLEMAVGVLILLLTVYLSTVVGPESHQ